MKPTRKTDYKPETIIFHKTRDRPDPTRPVNIPNTYTRVHLNAPYNVRRTCMLTTHMHTYKWVSGLTYVYKRIPIGLLPSLISIHESIHELKKYFLIEQSVKYIYIICICMYTHNTL